MPDANCQFVSSVTCAGRVIPLTKPIAAFNARRLQRILPEIAALNAAGKSQDQAAKALNTTVGTLRKWLAVTDTTWVNLRRRGQYKTNA